MVMAEMEDTMRRMTWTKDEETMVIIISITASIGLTLLILGCVCFWPIVTTLRRWRAKWRTSFRSKDHGDVELYEFETPTGSDRGGTNSRRASAGESAVPRGSSEQ
ncbi:hypothetical protein Q7P35_007970 [Cladosporium inversicolor]